MKIKLNLSKENILKVTTNYDIFNYYCTDFNKRIFCSEFRADPKPSANIYQSSSGDYIYHDFGNGLTLDCFAYVQKKYNLSFTEVLFKINFDMNLGLGLLSYGNPSSSSSSKKRQKLYKNSNTIAKETEINVKYRDFESRDKDYWTGRYYIPLKLVSHYFNFPIEWYRIIKEDYSFTKTPDDICYTQNYYIDQSGILRRKIYRPYGKEYKWTSNITTLVVQGIKHLEKTGDLLIITKSMKDLLVLRYLGYRNVIACNNESSFIPLDVLAKLKVRFKDIILLFDNDTTGITMSNKMSEEYSLRQLFTPEKKYKDPSDFIEEYGPKVVKQYFKDKINDGN